MITKPKPYPLATSAALLFGNWIQDPATNEWTRAFLPCPGMVAARVVYRTEGWTWQVFDCPRYPTVALRGGTVGEVAEEARDRADADLVIISREMMSGGGEPRVGAMLGRLFGRLTFAGPDAVAADVAGLVLRCEAFIARTLDGMDEATQRAERRDLTHAIDAAFDDELITRCVLRVIDHEIRCARDEAAPPSAPEELWPAQLWAAKIDKRWMTAAGRLVHAPELLTASQIVAGALAIGHPEIGLWPAHALDAARAGRKVTWRISCALAVFDITDTGAGATKDGERRADAAPAGELPS